MQIVNAWYNMNEVSSITYFLISFCVVQLFINDMSSYHDRWASYTSVCYSICLCLGLAYALFILKTIGLALSFMQGKNGSGFYLLLCTMSPLIIAMLLQMLLFCNVLIILGVVLPCLVLYVASMFLCFHVLPPWFSYYIPTIFIDIVIILGFWSTKCCSMLCHCSVGAFKMLLLLVKCYTILCDAWVHKCWIGNVYKLFDVLWLSFRF